jgi:type IV pilus assembly protein PilM
MLKLMKRFLPTPVNPIGIDFGSDSLRLTQVACENGEHRIVAAATADVPSHVRGSTAARLEFFTHAVRELLGQGGFRGRQAVLCLPGWSMFIQHLRLPRLGDEETRKLLPFETRGKIPIDPSQAILRHLVAGEVFSDQEPRNEVIVMAAPREFVNQLLDAAVKARLDIVGMTTEPTALVSCFSHIYRRKDDSTTVTGYIDIGASSTRATFAVGEQVLFARSIPIGGDHLTRAVAEALKIGFDDAKMLRIQLAAATSSSTASPSVPASDVASTSVTAPQTTASEDNSFALLGAAIARRERRSPDPLHVQSEASPPTADQQQQRVRQAVHDVAERLIEELNLCRRYHESAFPNRPLQRLVFVGGEARQKPLCQQIARELRLAAQIGDPMVRLGNNCELGPESGLDVTQPQPGWALSLGLSMGPRAVPQSVAA